MQVRPAGIADVHVIHVAYAHATRIQRAQGAAAGPPFSTETLRAEISARRVMLVHEDDALVGVFSVAYEAAAIWGTLERGTHLYLHRIARSPTYHTSGLIDAVLSWAREHGQETGRVGVRLDTWGSNRSLIAFYKGQGFTLVARRRIGAEPHLPARYHGRELALLEASCRRDAFDSRSASGRTRVSPMLESRTSASAQGLTGTGTDGSNAQANG